MVKFLPNELSAVDIINIASFNKAIRTAVNPFGRDAYQSRYGGKAVPWKLLKKSDKETTAAYLKRLAEISPKVSAGLNNAITMSQDAKYSKASGVGAGVAAVMYSDGSMGIMPAKSAAMAMDGKKGTVIEYRRYPSARAALHVVREAVPVMA